MEDKLNQGGCYITPPDMYGGCQVNPIPTYGGCQSIDINADRSSTGGYVNQTNIVHSIATIPQKYKTAYNPIIDTTYKLLISDNEKEIKKYLSENVDDFNSDFFNSNGNCYYKKGLAVMWARTTASAIHELVHGAWMPYEVIGIKFDDELLAYTVKFLYKELIENYNNPQVGIVFTENKTNERT